MKKCSRKCSIITVGLITIATLALSITSLIIVKSREYKDCFGLEDGTWLIMYGGVMTGTSLVPICALIMILIKRKGYSLLMISNLGIRIFGISLSFFGIFGLTSTSSKCRAELGNVWIFTIIVIVSELIFTIIVCPLFFRTVVSINDEVDHQINNEIGDDQL